MNKHQVRGLVWAFLKEKRAACERETVAAILATALSKIDIPKGPGQIYLDRYGMTDAQSTLGPDERNPDVVMALAAHWFAQLVEELTGEVLIKFPDEAAREKAAIVAFLETAPAAHYAAEDVTAAGA